MDATVTGRTRAGRLPPLRDERGMLLVITMLILLVVSTLGASNLINAFLERSIAKNQNYASIALNAADAGVDYWVTWLADPANKASTPYNVATCTSGGTPWKQSVTRTLASGGTFESSVVCKTDDENRDQDLLPNGDEDTSEYVLYNNPIPGALGAAGNHGKFNYLDAKEMNAAQGYPVLQINSRGTYGAAGYREIVMELAKVMEIPPGAQAAITSKEAVGFGTSNAQLKDGRAHAENGILCDGSNGTPTPPCECSRATDGLIVESGALAASDPGKTGTIFPTKPPGAEITENTGAPLCSSAECVLGFASRTALEADPNVVIFPIPPATTYTNAAVSSALETLPQGKIVIVKGNFTMTANTHVTLNKRLVVDGTFDALGNTDFKGLIVAKNFNTCGNLVVVGAMVAVGDGSGVKPFANGSVSIKYSCDALAGSAGQPGYRVRLGWHRTR